jgi:hypothetical protein
MINSIDKLYIKKQLRDKQYTLALQAIVKHIKDFINKYIKQLLLLLYFIIGIFLLISIIIKLIRKL